MEQNNYYYEQNSMQNPSGAASYCNGVIINNGIHERGMNDINEEDYFNSFPPGFRFCPEDIELIEDYLKKKVNGENLPPNKICVVELYQKHPSELAAKWQPITETEWYFFTSRKKKYPNGKRPNRSTPEDEAYGSGYWKPTGKDKPIQNTCGRAVGYKRTLDFYQGKHPTGLKTDWKMHEYRLTQTQNPNPNDMTLDNCVLCRLYRKREKNNGEKDEVSNGDNVNGSLAQHEELMAHDNDNVFEQNQLGLPQLGLQHQLYHQSNNFQTYGLQNNNGLQNCPMFWNNAGLSSHHQPIDNFGDEVESFFGGLGDLDSANGI